METIKAKFDGETAITDCGLRVKATQDAYISDDGKTYQANAGDYTIFWDVVNHDCDDQSSACNWDVCFIARNY